MIQDLKRSVAKELPDHRVESVIYPKYETKGELAEATAQFLEWYVLRPSIPPRVEPALLIQRQGSRSA